MPAETVYVGLGSNLDDPRSHVARAIVDLGSIPGCRLLASSSLYVSTPMGPQDQPDYINAVAELECTLEPMELLSELQRIEQHHKRTRERRWGPRTLDLDILLFGNQVIAESDLVIPHAGIAKRLFVLVPLLELAPQLEIPGLGPVSDIVGRKGAEPPVKLDSRNE